MLRTRYVKVHLLPLGEDRYFLSANEDDGGLLPVAAWKNLLFFRHEESFYGTMVKTERINGIAGVVVNGWDLVTLFAKEPFNRYIDWDWDELSQICLAAAPAVHEAILERDWLPDFAAWEHDTFRWALPQRVQTEFGPTFWDQKVSGHGDGSSDSFSGQEVSGSGHGDGSSDSFEQEAEVGSAEPAREPVLGFISRWYDGALDSYLNQNQEMKTLFGEKIEHLQEQDVNSRALAHFFTEESWKQWIGISEDPTPFTVGLQLEEPPEPEDNWTLNIFLRSKADEDKIYSVGEAPRNWKPYLEKVDQEQQRWLTLFPWLQGDGSYAFSGQRDGSGDSSGITGTLSENDAWEFLTEASETLVALGVEILLPGWWQAMKNASLKVKARVKGSSSRGPSFVGLQAMLDYDWRFSMNGVDLSEDEFQQLVEEKRRLVFVRGRWIKLDPQFIRQIQDLMKQAEKQGLQVRDLLEQELLGAEDSEDGDELENPKAFARIQIEMNRQWKKMMKQLSDGKEIPEEPVPAGFHGELRPYQQFGMSWMLFLREAGFGACLADDMGLGKTIQLICYLLAVKGQEGQGDGSCVPSSQASGKGQRDGSLVPSSQARGKGQGDGSPVPTSQASAVEAASGTALIVCPTSVLGNWQKEIERFAPDLKVYLHYGANRLKGEKFAAQAAAADIVLSSYGLTHLDLAEFEDITWSTIAIDEAQNIKNSATKQSRAVRKLRGRHHIALTGTPMENRLSELWSIFDFTNHGYLGSLGQFQKRFVAPIEKDGKKEKIEGLQTLIRPFLLRRTKQDQDVALNLPDKQEQKEYCPLTAEQASLYEQLLKDTFAEIEQLSGFERKGLILGMLGKLKQLCNHPALYLKEAHPKQLQERSTKMEKLADLVENVLDAGESCLIFTQYIHMGEMIRGLLKKKFGVDVPFLNGSVPKQQRDVMIQRFQDREFPVFLLSLKAGGTGLNLTAANHVIHYDRWWNPAVENQATDRAYRIGQNRFVHVHKLISTGTLEEKIDAMLEKKQSLNEQIIQSESWITELAPDELEELLRLG